MKVIVSLMEIDCHLHFRALVLLLSVETTSECKSRILPVSKGNVKNKQMYLRGNGGEMVMSGTKRFSSHMLTSKGHGRSKLTNLRTMRFLSLSWEVLRRPPWGWRCARRASPSRVCVCVRGRAMLCERASGTAGRPLASGCTGSGVWGELSILVAIRAFW